MWGYIELKFLI